MENKFKQPIYDKSNLIDFSRKNLWMQSIIKKEMSQPNLAFIFFCLLLTAAIIYVLFNIALI